MIIYIRKIEILEKLIRRIEIVLPISLISILTLILCSMNTYMRELQEWEKQHPPIVHTEQLSVREQFWRDLRAMEVPEYLLEEGTVQEEVVVTEEQELIEDCTVTTISEEIEDTKNVSCEQSDVELLARLMYAEEGIFISKLPLEEAKYVNQLAGSVVLHRMNSSFDGCKTIEEVIFEPGQYDCVRRGTLSQKVPEIEYEWARELLENGPIGPENMVFQAEFEQGSDVYEHIGNQYFCIK